MTDRETLLIGWINFAILSGGLMLFLRPLLHHFFFERRNKIKQLISESLESLELARERERKARELDEDLNDDIQERGRAITATCDKECESIINEARAKQRHILDNAAKGSEVERRKAVEMVRIHMLDGAFAKAKDIFQNNMSGGGAKRFVDKGLEELAQKRPFVQKSLKDGEVR